MNIFFPKIKSSSSWNDSSLKQIFKLSIFSWKTVAFYLNTCESCFAMCHFKNQEPLIFGVRQNIIHESCACCIGHAVVFRFEFERISKPSWRLEGEEYCEYVWKRKSDLFQTSRGLHSKNKVLVIVSKFCSVSLQLLVRAADDICFYHVSNNTLW